MVEKAKEIYSKYKSQILYLFFGGITTVINIVVFYVLNKGFNVNYQISNVVAWIASIMVAYITNKLWVFESKSKDKKAVIKESISFLVSRLITLAMEFILLFILIEKIQVVEIVSKIIVNIIVIVANYIFSKVFVFNDKKKLDFNKIIKFSIITIIIVLTYGFLSYEFEISYHGYDKRDNTYTVKENDDRNSTIELEDKNIITQVFEIKDDNALFLELPFYKYGNDDYVTGSYDAYIIDKDNKIVANKNLNTRYSKFSIDISNLKKGSYTLKLIYNTDKYAVDLYNNFCESNFYSIDDVVIDNQCLNIDIYSKNSSSIFKFNIKMFLVFIVLLFSCFIAMCKKMSLEKKFLLLSIPIYLLFIYMIKPHRGHDEFYHWVRVFEISEGGILSDTYNNKTGFMLPNVVASYDFGKIDYNDKEFISDGTMAVYNPLQYYPQLIGVTISKKLTDDSGIIYYISRLFNMIFCISLLYLTIKKIPYLKKTVFIISFIPIAIEGFVTMSGDGILLAMIMYLLAYILDIRENKKVVGKKDFIILFILSILIASSKIVYLPVIGLILLLKNENFKSKKHQVICTLIILLFSCLFNLVWLKLANNYLNIFTHGKSGDVINYIISNPFGYINTFVHSLDVVSSDLILQLFGRDMLWAETIHSNFFVPVFLLIVSLLSVISEDKKFKKISVFDLVLLIVIVLLVIGLVFTSIYIQWTSFGSSYIYGVQGRYFLPILLILFVLLYWINKIKIKINHDIFEKIIVCGCVIINYIMLIKILIYYM